MTKILFVDRDGTLIYEPVATKQINSLAEMRFMPYVISSLKRFVDAGYELVIVTNQDALGTPKNPRANYELINKKMVEVFASEGIYFKALLECPHLKEDNCACRKPKALLGELYLKNKHVNRADCLMVGDRDTDVGFAENLSIRGFKLTKNMDWRKITDALLSPARTATLKRKTKETDISVSLNLDGAGKGSAKTGIKFFDHMLEQLIKHGNFDLVLKCKGDIDVDEHHTIEDVALALGEAFKKALGDKRGIERYAWERILVMDEAKAEVALDISGRGSLVYKAKFDAPSTGGVDNQMWEHFFSSFAYTSGININIKVEGKNAHHKVECMFKAFARCLRDAVKITGTEISSTKGVL